MANTGSASGGGRLCGCPTLTWRTWTISPATRWAASSSGPYPPLYCGGLWLWNHDARQWAAYFGWNQQQVSWPVHAAGHAELCRNYLDLDLKGLGHAQRMAQEVHGLQGAFFTDVADRDGRQARNGKWDSHLDYNLTVGLQVASDCWRHFRFTGDEEFLRHQGYPLMKECVRLGFVRRDEDGVYHVPGTTGYEGHLRVADNVADLSAIRGSFQDTLDAAELLGVDPELREALRDLLAHLVEFRLIEDAGETVVATGVALEDRESSYEVKRGYRKGEALFYCGFWLPMAPAFPSGAVGLKDEGTPLLEAVRNGIRRVGPTFPGGWVPSAVFAARVGLGEEALDWLGRMLTTARGCPRDSCRKDRAGTAPRTSGLPSRRRWSATVSAPPRRPRCWRGVLTARPRKRTAT